VRAVDADAERLARSRLEARLLELHRLGAIGELDRERRDEAADLRHLLEVELVDRVADAVVVVVVPGEDVERRHRMLDEGVVVGAGLGVGEAMRGQVELRRGAPRGVAQAVPKSALQRAERAELDARLGGAADHVEVDHRDRLLERDDRVLAVVQRAEQPLLLGAERDEEDAPLRRNVPVRERLRDLEDRRRARGVVVGAVPDRVVADGAADPAGVGALRGADVVVVAAQDDVLVLQDRIAAAQDRDHVARRRLLLAAADRELERLEPAAVVAALLEPVLVEAVGDPFRGFVARGLAGAAAVARVVGEVVLVLAQVVGRDRDERALQRVLLRQRLGPRGSRGRIGGAGRSGRRGGGARRLLRRSDGSKERERSNRAKEHGGSREAAGRCGPAKGGGS
jgi:hypothetical protein